MENIYRLLHDGYRVTNKTRGTVTEYSFPEGYKKVVQRKYTLDYEFKSEKTWDNGMYTTHLGVYQELQSWENAEDVECQLYQECEGMNLAINSISFGGYQIVAEGVGEEEGERDELYTYDYESALNEFNEQVEFFGKVEA